MSTSSCGKFLMVLEQSGAEDAFLYVYDAATNDLVAVMKQSAQASAPNETCVAGPGQGFAWPLRHDTYFTQQCPTELACKGDAGPADAALE